MFRFAIYTACGYVTTVGNVINTLRWSVHGNVRKNPSFMSFNRQILKILITFCLLQWERRVVGEHTAVLSITRLKDGDVFTRITNGSDSMCQSWMAVDIVPFSRQNCSLTCKCRFPHGTFSIRLEKCVKEDEILKLNNCSGPFLPPFNQPLYNFARSGKARLNASFWGNRSADFCQITSIEYFNKTKRVKLTGPETKILNASRIENGSLSITWANKIMNIPQGNIVKLQILCDNMTSPSRNRCVLIKTAETLITNNLTRTKSPEKSSVCTNNSKTATDDMLIYILVGVGSGCVFVGGLVGLFVCLHRRRRRDSVSRPRTTVGLHRSFKTRSSNKGNEPAMPAIHEMIFNGLIWDDDGGFSNRAVTADPRFFEVDYGIPTDFSGSLTRPESSCESVRNSLSPLTDLGETAKR